VKTSKHIEILQSLSTSEIRKLDKFINSPYFNESRLVKLVHQYSLMLLSEKKNHKFSKRDMYELISPGKKYNDKNARKAISIYSGLLEKFLIYTEFKDETDSKNLLFLRALRLRNLDKFLGQAINNIKKSSKVRKVRSYDDYIYLLKLQDEEYGYFSNRIKGDKKKGWFKDQMKKFAEGTELNIVASTLATIQVVYYYSITDGDIDQEIFLMKEIIERIEKPGGLNYKEHYHYVYAKYLIVKTILEKTNKSRYREAYQYIIENKDKFIEGSVFYSMISLYVLATDQITLGRKDFSEILVEIYRIMDDGQVFSSFSAHYIFFIEITNACIYCNRSALAVSMLEKYSSQIDSSLRKDTVYICNAQISFSMNNYAEALKYIINVSYDTFFLYMEAKILQCKIYYVLKDTEGLLSLLQTVDQYFRRNKDLPGKDETHAYKAFFTSIKKLLRLSEKRNNEIKFFFKQHLSEINVYNKDWLISEAEKI
jgi:hypothetical protein